MGQYHPAPFCNNIILHHSATISSCTILQQYHPAPFCNNIILYHSATISSCTILQQYHPAPFCNNITLHHSATISSCTILQQYHPAPFCNITANVRLMYRGALVQPLLVWERNSAFLWFCCCWSPCGSQQYKPFSVAMETQQWFTAANSTYVLKSASNLRSILVWF